MSSKDRCLTSPQSFYDYRGFLPIYFCRVGTSTSTKFSFVDKGFPVSDTIPFRTLFDTSEGLLGRLGKDLSSNRKKREGRGTLGVLVRVSVFRPFIVSVITLSEDRTRSRVRELLVES